MVMKSRTASRTAKMIRYAPVAASLSLLAFVAACARTQGATPIGVEAMNKISKAALAQVADYDPKSPSNVAFAKNVKGASIIITNRTETSLRAQVKVVFNDGTPDIIKTNDILFDAAVAPPFITADGSIEMLTHCAAKCKVIDIELDHFSKAPAPAIPAPGTLATAPAPSTDAAAKASLNVAADVQPTTPAATIPAPAQPTVPAAAGTTADASTQAAPTAPVVAAAPTMVMDAKEVITFAVDTKGAKGETPADKMVRESIMPITWSGPSDATSASGSLMTYEAAFQAKYNSPAPTTAIDTDCAVKGADGIVDMSQCVAPSPAVGIGTTSPSVGAGTTSPAAPVATAPAAPDASTGLPSDDQADYSSQLAASPK